MRKSKLLVLPVLGLAVACGGPSSEGQDVKSPDDIIAEEERLAAEAEAKHGDTTAAGPEEATDDEKRKGFDKAQAELELKRAARSAEDCPNLHKDGPRGETTISMTFKNDGHVKEAALGPQFGETELGTCILTAMKAVIVPAYTGAEETVEWKLNLQETKKKK